jgi:adenylylsulfate kinase
MSLISLLKDQNSRTRSLAKALTWRVTATLTTALIAYIVTGEVRTAVIIGWIEFVLKFIIYYGHERAWNLLR